MFRTVNVSLFVVSLFISLCNAAPDIDDFTDFEKNEVQFNSVDGIFGQEFDFFDENGVSLLDFGDATDNIQQGSEISLREEPREIPEIWSWCKDPPTAFKDVTVLFENYPLRRGVPFYVIIKGTPTEALDNLVVRTRINVGSFFSVLDVQNLCKKAPEGCPLKTELQEQRLTFAIPYAVFGSLNAKSIMYANEEAIACLKLGPLVIER